MNRRVFDLTAAGLTMLLFVPLLSSCGSATQPKPSSALETPPHAKFLFDAPNIPLAVTQAVVLEDRLEQGTDLSTLAATDTFTLTTLDFYGAPFTHISITAPRPIDDIWAFAASLSEADWAGATESSPWRITVTGATTERSIMFEQEVGLGSFFDLYQTIKALGGPSKVKSIISALPGVELILDTSGVIWDPSTGKPIDAALLANAKAQYAEVVLANSNNEGAVGTLEPVGLTSEQSTATGRTLTDAEAWAAMMKRPAATLALGALSDTGDLDTRAFTRNLALLPSWRPPDDGGAIRGAMQKTPGYSAFRTYPTGYDQNTGNFGRAWGQKWSYFSCSTGAKVSVAVIGCGPSSFAGLLAFHFQYRGRTILNRKYDTRPGQGLASIDGMLYGLSNPRADRPLVSWYLGTCWFNGGATAANAYAGGITNFVRD